MIKQYENFNLKHIAESGQCFRMNPLDEISFGIVSYGKFLKLTQIEEDKVDFDCSEEDFNNIWLDYFDLDYDYKSIVTKLQTDEDDFLRKASEYGYGLRILKQEPFEALISFIISQNKNIPAIKSSIERLSKMYGEEIHVPGSDSIYYTFPSPEKLANASNEDLRKTGLGYRDEYIIRTSRAVANGDIDLNALKHVGHSDAVEALLTLHGVGIKVANCASLYGLHYIDAFPIDTWIKRILNEIYDNKFDIKKYDGYAGIVQQYMFYYMRNR